jgi:YggT family protein
MLNQMLVFLLETVLGLFAVTLLLRFWLQTLRAPLRGNPLYPFISALTDWLVLRGRKVIPGLFRLDLATLVLAWLTEVMLLLAKFSLLGFSLGPALGVNIVELLLLGAVEVLKLSLYILMVAVIAQVVLSWVAPYSPAMPVVNSLTRPFLKPFQERVPLIGNVDISPMILIVVVQLLLFVVAWVEGSVVRALG